MGAFASPKQLKIHFAGEEEVIARIEEVNKYLFRFSFERLQDFVKDPILMMLFYYMMEVEAGFPEPHNCPLHSLAEH
jgi:hypothetical protein